MAKNAWTDYDATAANNTDAGGIDIQGTASPAGFDNALRELMSQTADVVAGTSPVKDTFTLADPADLTKRFRFDGGSVTAGQTRVVTVPDADITLPSGAIVTEAGTQTLTNKSLSDSTTSFIDNADATKKLQFQISSITTATTRTVTWPDTDGTVWTTGQDATVTHYRANTADKLLTTDIVWSSAEEVTLTDAATITVDMSTFINAVVTLGGNRTLGSPTNEKVGQSGVIRIVQDGTGSRTLAYGTDWEFAGGSAPVLSTTAADQDLLFYYVIATNRVFGSLIKDIS